MPSRSGSLRSPSDYGTQHLAACDTCPPPSCKYHTLHHSDTIPTTATRHTSGLRGKIALAVCSLALLQPLVLVGLPPHTPLRYAENHTSRLFRFRSYNRSCSWGYCPTPRQGTRKITRRGYFACAPATARARGATAPHPARVRGRQLTPPTTLSRSGKSPPSCSATVRAVGCNLEVRVLAVGVVCRRDLAPSGRKATTAHDPLQRGISHLLRRCEIPRCTAARATSLQPSRPCLVTPHPTRGYSRSGRAVAPIGALVPIGYAPCRAKP